MRAHRDPDLLLVEAMTAPLPLEDARRSLAYWERRHRALPIYHRRARREAKEMTARWDERVRAAERIRFEASLGGRFLTWAGLSRVFEYRARFTKSGVLLLAWTLVPGRVKLIAGGVVAAWLFVALGAFALLATALNHLT